MKDQLLFSLGVIIKWSSDLRLIYAYDESMTMKVVRCVSSILEIIILIFIVLGYCILKFLRSYKKDISLRCDEAGFNVKYIDINGFILEKISALPVTGRELFGNMPQVNINFHPQLNIITLFFTFQRFLLK